jgi:protein transport protein SEC13
MRDFEAPVWRVSWSLTGDMLSVAAGEGDITLWKEASDGQWESLWTKASEEPQAEQSEQAAEEEEAAQ